MGATRRCRGLAGALLLDLVVEGRLRVEPSRRTPRIVPVERGPSGNALADLAAVWLDRPIRAHRAVDGLAHDHLPRMVLDRLAARGLVCPRRERALGISVERWPAADPGRHDLLGGRLPRVLHGSTSPTEHEAVLLAMVGAAGAGRKLFGSLDRRPPTWAFAPHVEWAVDAVGRAVQASRS